MAKYVDGFVLVVPKKNVKAYEKMAREGAKVWKKFGALDYYECMGDDLIMKPAPGMPKHRAFGEMAKAGKADTVWFSFVVYKNKKHRDQVNKKVMDFFNKKYKDQKNAPDMPFDMKRMAYGGFEVKVEA